MMSANMLTHSRYSISYHFAKWVVDTPLDLLPLVKFKMVHIFCSKCLEARQVFFNIDHPFQRGDRRQTSESDEADVYGRQILYRHHILTSEDGPRSERISNLSNGHRPITFK